MPLSWMVEAFCRAVAASDHAAARIAATEALKDELPIGVDLDPDCVAALAGFRDWLLGCRCVASVEAMSGLMKSEPPQKLLLVETKRSAFPRTLRLTLLLERPMRVVSIETE